MTDLNDYIPLRDFCREVSWPRITQFNHWITSKHPLAKKCIKKVGGRYIINKKLFTEIVSRSNLEGEDMNDIQD